MRNLKIGLIGVVFVILLTAIFVQTTNKRPPAADVQVYNNERRRDDRLRQRKDLHKKRKDFDKRRRDLDKRSDSEVQCIQIYQPVCGVDGKTYSNRCVAVKQNNVDVVYEGECKATPSLPSPSTTATLLFKSGFEPAVALMRPTAPQSQQWWQILSGRDTTTNYTWSDDLPGSSASKFQYLVGAAQKLSDFIETRIDTIIGPGGSQTQALYQAVKKDDPNYTATTRNQYNMYPTDQGSLEKAYIKYWIQFQNDLDTLMPQNSWRNLMEWRESGDDYRFTLYIIKPKNSNQLAWKLEGQLGVLGSSPIDWTLVNTTIPAPVGKWFLLEVFWNRDSANGRVYVAVDGQTVFDKTGRNKKDSKLTVWNPFKVYTDSSFLKNGSFYQWIDDVEIYSDFPSR